LKAEQIITRKEELAKLEEKRREEKRREGL